jgi:hypothetical protein
MSVSPGKRTNRRSGILQRGRTEDLSGLATKQDVAPSICYFGSLAHDFERARNLSTLALITQLRESGTQRCARDFN